MRLEVIFPSMAFAALVFISCEPEQHEFQVQNKTQLVVSATFGTNDRHISGNHYRYYSTLPIGSIDMNEWCTFCHVQPNALSRLTFFPFDNSDRIFFAARDSTSKELIYYQEYSLKDLKNLKGIVPIVDQRP